MTDTDRWIVITRWDEFQHPDTARSSVPPWVKAYTKLLANDDFLDLSHHLRGVLLSLWLEYARSTRQLRDSTSAISRRVGQRVTRRDLEELNHAGFIDFSASKPASKPQADLLAEIEKEKELRPSTSTEPSRARTRETRLTCPECHVLTFTTPTELADHLEHVHWIEPNDTDHALAQGDTP